MATFTVHARRDETPEDAAENVVLVRDGFAPLALVFGGLWFLWHRMWLVLIAYILVVVGLAGLIASGVIAPLGAMFLQSLLAFVVGLEASGLRRWTVERSGYQEVAVVAGQNRDEAELRYFAHTV